MLIINADISGETVTFLLSREKRNAQEECGQSMEMREKHAKYKSLV
jgi:hypothetical protein